MLVIDSLDMDTLDRYAGVCEVDQRGALVIDSLDMDTLDLYAGVCEVVRRDALDIKNNILYKFNSQRCNDTVPSE